MKEFAIALTKAIVIGVTAHYTTKAAIKVIDAQVAKKAK
ncbi:hypothetical protein [Pseudomonas phage D6]|nr:hypothetical protein [Pseudomonas phage D6]